MAAVEQRTLVERVDRGFVLGNDAWSQISPALRLMDARGVVRVDPGPDAADAILVVDDRSLASARAIAEQVVRERTQ